MGKSEEAVHCSLSTHEPGNPEQKETALFFFFYRTKDSPPGPPPGEGMPLSSPCPEKEQLPISLGCRCQGHFIDFLANLGAGWDRGP